jgi:hypothetical protein
VTRAYGYTLDKDHNQIPDVAPAAEIEFDRKYWVDEHKITFPIGIDVTQMIPDTTDKSGKKMKYAQSKNALNYNVTGIPTVLLIDRGGIVRFVRVGSGNDFEAVMAAEIEKLLGEGRTGSN